MDKQTIVLSVVHLVLTGVLLAYMADVVLPFYAYHKDAGRTFTTPAVSPTPIAWAQAPLFIVQNPQEHARQLAQRVVHHSADAAVKLNSAVLWRSSVFQLLLAAVTFLVLTRVVPAPYGRHTQRLRFPLTLPSHVSWMLQESPTLFNVVYFIAIEYPRVMGHGIFSANKSTISAQQHSTAASSFPAEQQPPRLYGSCSSYGDCVWTACTQQHLGLLLFVIHYVHRSWIYPLAIPAARIVCR
uniref:Putative 3-oxo-5-alpha-steroid 4-dehydrogenase n=1 Tax=Angomonas deanei TaxID=59799 RepID=C6K3R3_9TRYP|nr:putative 3-oxo-5-alpha-steroid 4-dehydrogenase [Angomonas deanei]